MKVCPERFPVQVRPGGERRVECWLHGPDELIPEGGTAPMEREEIAVADEA
jgi:peptide/nickel transport system ATP-binding protein